MRCPEQIFNILDNLICWSNQQQCSNDINVNYFALLQSVWAEENDTKAPQTCKEKDKYIQNKGNEIVKIDELRIALSSKGLMLSQQSKKAE